MCPLDTAAYWAALLLLVAPGHPHAAQEPPIRTTETVMFDDRYDVGGHAGPHEPKMQFFRTVGFEGLRAEALAAWMEDRINAGTYGTACLLPSGILPARLLTPDGWAAVKQQWLDRSHQGTCLTRRFTDAGGRLVWIADVVFYCLQGGPAGPIRCAAPASPAGSLSHRPAHLLWPAQRGDDSHRGERALGPGSTVPGQSHQPGPDAAVGDGAARWPRTRDREHAAPAWDPADDLQDIRGWAHGAGLRPKRPGADRRCRWKCGSTTGAFR